MAITDRQRGALLGLAIGDALGAAVEFRSPGSFEEVTDYRDGGPHGLSAGEWTDDTSLALAMADSIVETGWDLDDQARRYVRWWRNGAYSVNGRCFDIGGTTVRGLTRFEHLGDAYRSGETGEWASGNGSIMRLAPVPIRYSHLFPDRLEKLVELGVDSSRPTHASPQCLSACAYLTVVLSALIEGHDRDEVLDPQWPALSDIKRLFPLDPEIEKVADGSFREKQPPEISGAGHVVRTLEAALWAFHDATDFAHAVLRAVNLGDDSDTTGAVCGQLAGAYWGESQIPHHWRANLARRDMIDPILHRLVAAAEEDRRRTSEGS